MINRTDHGGDAFVDDDLDKALVRASDFAILKREVDVVVEGHAYAPKPESTMGQIALRMRSSSGTIDRTFSVFGDRVWQGRLQALPSAPATFDKLPLTYERAFGGPDYLANPVGVGHKEAADASGAKRLPNFETPSKPVVSPNDTPPPAGLGPIHPQWKARWSLMGTYDPAWFGTRWPYYPRDFDYGYFQSAPPGQRLASVNGDEEFELLGLHREHASLRGRLPGVRARAFVQRTGASGEAFVELPLRIDTITFSPDEDAIHVVWRGNLDVSDDDAPEIACVFVTSEQVEGPALSTESAHARYAAAIAPKPEDALEPPPPPPPPPREATTEEREEEEADRKVEAALIARTAELEKLLPPPVEVVAETPLPEPNLESVAQAMRAAGANESDVAEMLAALRPPIETEPPPPPPVDLRELVKARIANGESLDELDLRGADLCDLDLSAQSLVDTDLGAANLERADLTAVIASGARFVGANLTDAKLEGAILSGADIEMASFARAKLKQARLDGVEGKGASFVDADLAGAMLDDVTLERVDLRRANLASASLTNAILTGATVEGANFRGATMTAVRLFDARGEGRHSTAQT